jgi:tetratricopeptide (TPR) repeat protein
MRLSPVFILVLLSQSVFAENKSVARDAYREGTRLYDVGEYKQALEAFKKAYLNYEEPTFLFNMAQCFRQLGDKPEAIRMYKSYLRKMENAPNRGDVKAIVATLESAIEQERATRSVPPQGTMGPPGTTPPEGPPPPEQPPTPPPQQPPPPQTTTTTTQSTTTASTSTTSSEAPTPIYKKWWLWTVVGVVVVGVAVGAGVGVAYHNSFDTTLSSFNKSSGLLVNTPSLQVRF